MAAFWAIFSFYLVKISTKIRNLDFLSFATAAVFTLIEYLRSWAFGILWLGNGTLLGPHWTLGNITYLFPIKPFLNLSSFIGIYGIDFLIVFLSISIFLLIKTRKIVFLLETLAVITIISTVTIYNPSTSPSKTITVSPIQTKIDTGVVKSIDSTITDINQKINLLKDAAKSNSAIIIFPESTNLSNDLSIFLDSASAKNFFKNLHPNNLTILDNSKITEEDGFKSRAIVIDSENGLLGFYDKKLLTPGGEFLPYLIKWPLLILSPKLIADFNTQREFKKGNTANIISVAGESAKISICSDIISPDLIRRGNFSFIIVVNNLWIFSGSIHLENQLISTARFRAAENQKYLVTSSNFGKSYIVNSQGGIEKMSNENGPSILTVDVAPNDFKTWYNKFGDWPVLMVVFVFLLLTFLKIWLLNSKHAE